MAKLNTTGESKAYYTYDEAMVILKTASGQFYLHADTWLACIDKENSGWRGSATIQFSRRAAIKYLEGAMKSFSDRAKISICVLPVTRRSGASALIFIGAAL